MFACQLKSEPRMLEPMYVVDIVVPQNHMSGVYNTLNQRRGTVEGTEERPGTPLCKVQAYLPVLESFGFPQMIFSHWQEVNGNPLEEGSQANGIIKDVRKR